MLGLDIGVLLFLFPVWGGMINLIYWGCFWAINELLFYVNQIQFACLKQIIF